MKFVDLNKQYQQIKTSVDAAIRRVLEHTQFIMGPEVVTVEQRLAELVKVKHCITVSSGTTALQVALMALEIKPGDEVITSPFNFFATTEVINLFGAVPVYVDIDLRTYNIDPDKIESVITPRTKAIIPVSLYGQCAEMDAINRIAKKYQLPVIEDGGQSLGATYKGRPSCGLSLIGCTSFFPSKPLGCYGDGGACFTNDDEIAKRMRLVRDHGQDKRYHHICLGINGRFDSIQAAILLAKLECFANELKQRQQIASWYTHHLREQSIILPFILPHNVSSYAQYTIQIDNRDQIQKILAEQGIPTAVHYPLGLHQQPYAKKTRIKQEAFPLTEYAAERVLSLPFHPYMTEEMVIEVVNKLMDVRAELEV